METATYLLFLLGWLGAADILLFHSVAHGIRTHANSRWELLAHSLRGPTYALLFIVIPNFQVQGAFAWVILGLFLIDVGISIADFSLEQRSRRLLGGLPSGEYVLHMIMAIVFGGLVTAFIYGARGRFSVPAQIAYVPVAVPDLVRLVMLAMAILVSGSGAQDAVAFMRLRLCARDEIGISRETNWTTLRDKFPRSEISVCSDLSYSKVRDCPKWLCFTLIGAGIYNLLWGFWVVLFPLTLFRLAGLATINYPQIWQCVGMIVGVYGIGYLLAARDPLRHWPIVLVGLLGKILGPIGMGFSVLSGSLPLSIAWMVLTNDLIWWVPFVLILLRVARTPQTDFNNPDVFRTI